jgi:DNA-damage-inducible protein D
MENNTIITFDTPQIRKIWQDTEWFFSVIDIIIVLTDSVAPSKYWSALKKREPQLSTICRRLKLLSVDKKKYLTDCTNREGVLRLIQSINSEKAEPFKQWLAQIGIERIDETENPEIAIDRLKEIYQAKGYSDEWIERRLKSISIRKELTDEWKKRGVKEGQEYAILTAEIARATFGVLPNEHAKLKGLTKENLRDHMTNFELIFTMLGEDATRQIADMDDAQGFNENHDAAQTGGRAAGRALKAFEEDKKIKVVASSNFLNLLNEENKEERENEDPSV